jgi:hypothetical protein
MASRAVMPTPRLGPYGVSAEATQWPLTTFSRTSTQNQEQDNRNVCIAPTIGL